MIRVHPEGVRCAFIVRAGSQGPLQGHAVTQTDRQTDQLQLQLQFAGGLQCVAPRAVQEIPMRAC